MGNHSSKTRDCKDKPPSYNEIVKHPIIKSIPCDMCSVNTPENDLTTSYNKKNV